MQTYGISAAYTVTQLENMARVAMTPTDWQQLAKACLTPGQYLDFKSFLVEYAGEQAIINQQQGQPAWDRYMLLGQG